SAEPLEGDSSATRGDYRAIPRERGQGGVEAARQRLRGNAGPGRAYDPVPIADDTSTPCALRPSRALHLYRGSAPPPPNVSSPSRSDRAGRGRAGDPILELRSSAMPALSAAFTRKRRGQLRAPELVRSTKAGSSLSSEMA